MTHANRKRKMKTSKHSTVIEANRQTLSVTVKELMEDYLYRIDLDADYQREKVWSKKNQEELIDSILKDIDIPKLYLAKIKNNKQFDYECIDGKQRMLTLMNFITPEKGDDSPLSVNLLNKKYTYQQLKKDLPNIAKKLDNYELNFVVYDQDCLEEDFIREIFRRLQLGIRLNSGELLNSETGNIRDFIFKEIGKDGPFLRKTNLSDKRYSRQFTLAQICINSFNRQATGEFGRARLTDIQYFFKEQEKIEKNDDNLTRIREVLKIMDEGFGENAAILSSRATAVSAYLFCESLYQENKSNTIPQFAKFYSALLKEIKHNMELLSDWEKPQNPKIMEGFQKFIIQASVEPSSIRRRDEFLKEAFAYYTNPATKGMLIGSR